MSLYNLMGGGSSPMVAMLLKIVSNEGAFAPDRLRDAWLEDGGKVIVVLTRTGGGNRDDYQDSNDALTRHPLYMGDEDDDFDSTFAKWRFRSPDKVTPQLAAIFDYLYATEKQGVKATTDRALAQLGGKPPVARDPMTDEKREAIRKAASELYDIVMGVKS